MLITKNSSTNIQLKSFNIICFVSMYCVQQMSAPVKGIFFKNKYIAKLCFVWMTIKVTVSSACIWVMLERTEDLELTHLEVFVNCTIQTELYPKCFVYVNKYPYLLTITYEFKLTFSFVSSTKAKLKRPLIGFYQWVRNGRKGLDPDWLLMMRLSHLWMSCSSYPWET